MIFFILLKSTMTAPPVPGMVSPRKWGGTGAYRDERRLGLSGQVYDAGYFIGVAGFQHAGRFDGVHKAHISGILLKYIVFKNHIINTDYFSQFFFLYHHRLPI